MQGVIDSLGYIVFRPSAGKPAIVKKILVSRIDHLGDVFLASSIIPHLRNAYPGAEIHFLAGEWALSYLKNHPGVDRVLVYNSFWHNRSRGFFKKAVSAVSGYVRSAREMRKASYDLSIDLRTYPCNSIHLLFLGRCRYRVGFSTGGFGFLLNKIVPYRAGVHEVAHVADALNSLGIQADEKDIRPEFIPTRTALKDGTRILEGLGIRENEPFVLIHTGSGNPAKHWRKKEWQGVITGIRRAYGVKVVVFDTVYGDLDGCVSLPGFITLELFAAIARRASLFMGLDSLPAHLAASFGTPVISVWCGINDPGRWRPVGDKVVVVKKDVSCSPCFRKRGCPPMECMDIGAEDCLREAARFLKPVRNPKVIQFVARPAYN